MACVWVMRATSFSSLISSSNPRRPALKNTCDVLVSLKQKLSLNKHIGERKVVCEVGDPYPFSILYSCSQHYCHVKGKGCWYVCGRGEKQKETSVQDFWLAQEISSGFSGKIPSQCHDTHHFRRMRPQIQKDQQALNQP